MTQNQKAKLAKILNDNSKWPIVLENICAEEFSGSIILSATINSSELGIIPTENGFKYPIFIEKIKDKEKTSKTILLIIDGLDNITLEDQEKFYGIIKYKGINGYKFPKSTQIVIPVKNVEKVSKKITSLCLIYKVD